MTNIFSEFIALSSAESFCYTHHNDSMPFSMDVGGGEGDCLNVKIPGKRLTTAYKTAFFKMLNLPENFSEFLIYLIGYFKLSSIMGTKPSFHRKDQFGQGAVLYIYD
jgi:hypothetical protein